MVYVVKDTKSVSGALDLVLVDTGDSFKISHAASASALAVLHLEGPSI